jgi:hypothetical protein
MNVQKAKSDLKTALRCWYDFYKQQSLLGMPEEQSRLFEAYRDLLIASAQKRKIRQFGSGNVA